MLLNHSPGFRILISLNHLPPVHRRRALPFRHELPETHMDVTDGWVRDSYIIIETFIATAGH